jgi:hypothetical protein
MGRAAHELRRQEIKLGIFSAHNARLGFRSKRYQAPLPMLEMIAHSGISLAGDTLASRLKQTDLHAVCA